MNILVVSPHPDDETLGAGGSLLKLKEENKIYWLNITDLCADLGYTKNQMNVRSEQIEKIKNFYRFDGTKNLMLPTTKLREVPDNEVISAIGNYIDEISANWIFLPDYNDAHSDHKIVFDWCLACTKVFRHPSVKNVLTMEILSETNFGHPDSPFIPNFYFDISDTLEQKIQASMIYDTEMGKHPFPRNQEDIKALAMLRGSEAGVKYAEAFRVIKMIQ